MDSVLNQKKLDEWACSTCTLLNKSDSDSCLVCLGSKSNGSTTVATGSKLKDRIVVKRFLSTSKPSSADLTKSQSDVRETNVPVTNGSNASWVCERCTLVNEPHIRHCAACQFAYRPKSNNPSDLPLFPVRQCSETMDALRLVEESEAQEQMNNILAYCRENRMAFVDTSFPPNNDSIGRMGLEEHAKHPTIKWCRPYQIFTTDHPSILWTIYCNPKPTDMTQGILGNCWFLSALAMLAEKSDLLEHIIVTRTVCRDGAYQIRLCIDGRWRIILIDDLFPCDQRNMFIYSQARRRQLWVPLIEKALAKVHGCYSALSAGRTVEGLAVLTGAPCISISLEDDEAGGAFDANFTWARLLSAREAGFLMGASCGAGRRVANHEEYLKLGLYSKHAYSLLDLRDVHGIRLVKLRNPWGRGVWNGAWSEASDLWSPDLRQQLQPEGPGEGVFWMPFEEFHTYFDTVDVCKLKPDCKEIRMYSILPPHCLSGFVSATYVTIDETSEVDFTLYQSGIRSDVLSKHGVLDLCILIFETDNFGKIGKLVAHSGRHIKPFVVCNAILRAGVYVCFTLSFSHYGLMMLPEEIPKSVLAVHTIHSASAQLTSVEPIMIADCLISFLLAHGDCRNEMTGVTVYFSPKRWSGLAIMVENRSYDMTVVVKCNCSESENIVSSRGDLETADVIPPWHRQIILILTQIEPTASYVIKHSLWYTQSFDAHLGKYAPEKKCSPYVNHYPEIDEKIAGLHICRPILK